MSILKWLTKILTRKITASKHNTSASSRREPQASPSSRQPEQLKEQLNWLKTHLAHCADVTYHTFTVGPQLPCALIYLKGMVNLNSIQQDILKPLQAMESNDPLTDITEDVFTSKRLPIASQTVYNALQDALSSILKGEAVLLVDGEARSLSLDVSKLNKRSVDEAPNETVIRGPREAFIENLETNLTLLRRRLQTPAFKIHMMEIGRETHTSVAVTYLEGVCKKQLLDEVIVRLSEIDIDAVLDSGYLEELIEDNPYSPFPQLQYTERPDTASAAILEGRIVILVNGSPISILAPVTFFMLMQSAEDYYQRFIAASWIRLIRYLFLIISVLLPSLYIAITTFHPDVIPGRLLITLASSREVLPFPALVEAFLMELCFEALREATLRIPKALGQSVSIIGALIIGTAAVEAGIASAAMVIIVSLTGIASFITPHYELGLAFRLLRFPIMILAGIFGLFGIACGMIILYLHLLNLYSFGVPYLSPITPYQSQASKDILLRAPWWSMKMRPAFSNRPQDYRQNKKHRKWKLNNQDEE